mmetsp:Transcript_3899/g.7856  ORF Transcript_3899/g.7856 Transcript_3899/m.7856 type:complete len:122 (+) Transcript_3899:210-575(+)
MLSALQAKVPSCCHLHVCALCKHLGWRPSLILQALRSCVTRLAGVVDIGGDTFIDIASYPSAYLMATPCCSVVICPVANISHVGRVHQTIQERICFLKTPKQSMFCSVRLMLIPRKQSLSI